MRELKMLGPQLASCQVLKPVQLADHGHRRTRGDSGGSGRIRMWPAAQQATDGLLAPQDAADADPAPRPALGQDCSFLDLFAFLTLYFLYGIACGAGSPDGQGRSRTAVRRKRFLHRSLY